MTEELHVKWKKWKSTMKRVRKAIQCKSLTYSGESPAITIWCEEKNAKIKVDKCAYCWKFVKNKKKGLDNFL